MELKLLVKNSPNLKTQTFRTDIQALRGFAVLIVLFYHANVGFLSAGFLGVDVFFVISGFLITGVVKKSIECGDFRFSEFYFRRAKRLLPAAYVTFLGTAILAQFCLASSEMGDFKSQLVGALAFFANITLWQQTGYFAGSAELKPLLHVWSLSIEEQYYFVLPALMFFIPRRFWKRAAFLVLIASLVLCQIMVHRDVDATFYLLPTRAWELAIGSVGALILVGKRIDRLLLLAFWPSLALLLILPLVSVAKFHPGPDALLICLATLVIVLRKHPLLFRGPVMIGLGWVGDISYSLYLVHWPLFAFLNNSWLGKIGSEPPLIFRVGLLVLSFALAWLLNRYVEVPTRRADIRPTRRGLVYTATTILVLAVLPLGIFQAAAIDKDFTIVRRANRGFAPECEFRTNFSPIPECRNSDQPEFLVWGDSFAMHLIPGLLGAKSGAPAMVQATRSLCGPLLGISPSNESGRYNRQWAEKCIDFNDSVINYLAETDSVKTVVLSSPFGAYVLDERTILVKNYDNGSYNLTNTNLADAVAGIKKTVEAVRSLGKKIVVISPTPMSGVDIGLCLERYYNNLLSLGVEDECQISVNSWKEYQGPVLEFLSVLPEQADVEVINLGDYLCDSDLCRTTIDSTFVYRDLGHFSYEGAVLVSNNMGWIEKIEKLAK